MVSGGGGIAFSSIKVRELSAIFAISMMAFGTSGANPLLGLVQVL